MPLSDRYEVLGRIGRGAFGEVFRVRERCSGRIAAAKRLRVAPAGDARQLLPAALFCELEALRQVRHPNVVELLDVVPDGAGVSLVLEFVPADLLQLLRRRREPLGLPDVRGLLRMLLLALAHCHERGVVHRDLKPANVLVTARGELKLSDFGLATALPVDAAATMSHQVATRWYRAPELLFGGRHYGAAVDMWAAGAILAELLAAVPLFPGANDLDQLHRVLQEVAALPDYAKVSFPDYAPLRLAHILHDAPAAAVDLLDKLLALDPRRRPTAREANRLATKRMNDDGLTNWQALAHEFLVDGPTNARLSFASERRPTEGDEAQGAELPPLLGHQASQHDDDALLASLGKPLGWRPATRS